MEVLHGSGVLPLERGPTVVTVGFFDGVHVGHQAVLSRTVAEARRRGLPSVAVTFDRHPREVFAPGTEPPLITSLERRAELIGAQGLDALLVLEFTAEFAAWPPEAFVTRVLAEGLAAVHVAVGTNFTFGFRGAGTPETLVELGPSAGFTAEGVPLVDVAGRTASSSAVRRAVADGDLAWPREALGRHFAVDGTVVTGAGRGAGLGYPTANLEVPPRMLLPARGVYAGRGLAAGTWYPAAVNVGTNPTFDEEPLHVEAFLLGFHGDLRGAPMTVEFRERLRDEERFESPEALSRQIALDVERTRAVVGDAAVGPGRAGA